MKWSPRKVTLQGFKKTLQLGDKERPPVVQSMLDTPADGVEESLKQIEELHTAGCEVIRISIPSKSSLRAAEQIVSRLENDNIPHILVADIHFAPHLALDSLDIFHKVRVNPGNFVEKNQGRSELLSEEEKAAIYDKLQAKFLPVVEKAARLNRALRIGVNHGSLGDRMVQTYGDTPRGMVESAFEYLQLALAQGFDQMVVSLKASNVLQMLEANQLFVAEAMRRDLQFPLHLGITEAGAGLPARIKSAQGIGYLVQLGVGETVRVSLAEDPVAEVPVSRRIAELGQALYRSRRAHIDHANFDQPVQVNRDVELVSLSGEVLTAGDGLEALPLSTENTDRIPIDLTSGEGIELAVKTAPLFLAAAPKQVLVKTPDDLQLAAWLLQAARIKSFETEFIACPGCARTLFNLQTVTDRISNAFKGYPGLKIAVMGCIVNGPGEMADADYGYVGAGKEKIDLYRGRDVVVKGLAPADALPALADLIGADHPEWTMPAFR